MTSLWLTLLVALPPPGAVGEICGIQPLGWTPDGSAFVYKQMQTLRGGNADSAPGGAQALRAVYATVMDAFTGSEERYLLEPTGDSPEERARMARFELPPAQADAFAAWLAAHPLQAPSYKPSCSSKALQVRGDNVVVAWREGGFAFEAGRAGVMELVTSVHSVSATYTSARWQLHDSATKPGAMRGQVLAVCSPNTLRVAWLLCRAGDAAGGNAEPPEFKVLLGPAAGPRIELLGAEAMDPMSLKRTTEALAKAGFVAIRRSVAQDKRARSVVYAPKQLMALAQRVAKAIPGGATVEPLTWQPECDMVVALAAAAP